MAHYPRTSCEEDAIFILGWLKLNKINHIKQLIEMDNENKLKLFSIQSVDNEDYPLSITMRFGYFGAVFTLYEDNDGIKIDEECMADKSEGGFVYINMDMDKILSKVD